MLNAKEAWFVISKMYKRREFTELNEELLMETWFMVAEKKMERNDVDLTKVNGDKLFWSGKGLIKELEQKGLIKTSGKIQQEIATFANGDIRTRGGKPKEIDKVASVVELTNKGKKLLEKGR